MDVQVREAREQDFATVAGLVEVLRVLEGIDEPLDVAAVHGFAESPGATLLVAEVDGRVAGCLGLRVSSDLFHGGLSADILELVVDSAHRRQGVGGALLDEAIVRAEAAGCAEIGLATGSGNEAARALYESRGLREEGIYMERHF